MALRPLYPVIAALLWIPLAARSASQSQFGGTWEAKLNGAVICTLKLNAGAKITGAMYGCSVHVNDRGDLIESEAPNLEEPSPILNTKLQNGTLAFKTSDPDDERPLRFELRLTSRSRADLMILDAPVRTKPIRFEKQ
jgi:hypothetical protein